MWGYKFMPTFSGVITFSFILGTLLVVFGIIILVASADVKEITIIYDSYSKMKNNVNPCKGKRYCQVLLNVQRAIPAPVYLYYQFTNFYQNHRLYVRSTNY